MTEDIVDRLRRYHGHYQDVEPGECVQCDAADEIDRLRIIEAENQP